MDKNRKVAVSKIVETNFEITRGVFYGEVQENIKLFLCNFYDNATII